MKIKTRKVVEEEKYWFDTNTKKKHKYVVNYENGYVEELEIDLNSISAFSTEKNSRIIGVEKNIYLLTLKSWKEVKNALQKSGLMYRFNLEKRN